MNVSRCPYAGVRRPLPALTNCPNGGATGILLPTAPSAAAEIEVALPIAVTPWPAGAVAEVQLTGTDNFPIGTELPSPPATPPTLLDNLGNAAAAPYAAASTFGNTGATSLAKVPSLAKPAISSPRNSVLCSSYATEFR